MRRHGDLWRHVVDPENIDRAYQNARRGKAWQRTVQAIDERKDDALAELRTMLINDRFRTSEYRVKYVLEPKPRTIYVLPFWPDRIVQHAVMNVVAPIWDSKMDTGSHACRPGKGQHTASREVMRHVRRYRYVFQADVKKFYPSIPHDGAMRVIRRKIKDRRVLALLEDIVCSFPGSRNVPIGNLTSQWIGNLYLNELDRFVRHTLKPRGYVRYNDDFLLFTDHKDQAHAWRQQVGEFLMEELELTMAKDRVYPVGLGVDYVGYRHFPDKVLIRKSTARRMRRRVRHLRYLMAAGQVELDRARSTVAAISGWLRWSNAYNLSRALRIDALQEEIVAAVR